ncbi:hypothetical protein R3P38DRAFT_3522780 [Favolaschia claudopus]|uniref:Uncharacterized protein n=1 Tax=Favolaschia claudopus TaxID=2862362 RepID=A0AAW0E2D5_9AGAR
MGNYGSHGALEAYSGIEKLTKTVAKFFALSIFERPRTTPSLGSARQQGIRPPSFPVSPIANGTRHDVSYPASPYPAASILKEYDGSDIDNEARAKRRDDKARAPPPKPSRGSSIAAEVPLPSSDIPRSDNDFDILSLTSHRVRRMNAEAAARERAIHDDSSEARRRRADRVAGLERLRQLRIQQDEEYAREMERLWASEDDREFAESIQRQQYEEETQSVLRSQRDAAEEEEKARVAAEAAAAAQEIAHAALEAARERCLKVDAQAQRVKAEFKPEPVSREEDDARKPHALKDRVILQRLREAELKQFGLTRYLDQGIGWDEAGAPIEIGPAPNKRNSIDFGEVPSAKKASVKPSGTAVAAPVRDEKPARMVSKNEGKPQKKEEPSERAAPQRAADLSKKDSSKKDESSDFYLKSRTAPKGATPPEGGDSSGSDSDEGSGSSDSEDESEDSQASHGTYREETTYSRSEPTDSALESDSSRKKKKKNEKRRKRYRFVRREPVQNEPRTRDVRPDSARIIPKDASRQAGRDGGGYGNNPRPYPKPSQGSKPPVPQPGPSKKAPVCYKCGGPHYRNQCVHDKRTPILYHGREIVNDNEEEQEAHPPSQDKSTSEPPVEHLKQMADEDDEVDDENVDVDGDDLPELMDVTDDSEVDSESEYECSRLKPKPKRREPTLEELGLFGVCDDYSDDEFVTESDVEGLAKEMAQCLMATISRQDESATTILSPKRDRNEVFI